MQRYLRKVSIAVALAGILATAAFLSFAGVFADSRPVSPPAEPEMVCCETVSACGVQSACGAGDQDELK